MKKCPFWVSNNLCLIVDTSVSGIFFGPTSKNPYIDALKCVLSGRTKFVTGGKNLDELSKNAKIRTQIVRWGGLGLAITVEKRAIITEIQRVIASRLCKSNDEHIIALAKISKARTLCTNDRLLQDDFKNIRLLRPKGRIFKDGTHAHIFDRIKCRCKSK